MNPKLNCIATLCACSLLAGLALPVSVVAQSQEAPQPSVAEAARRAREKKQTPAKPAKVITNDDLQPAPPWMAAPPAQASSAPTSDASKKAAGASEQSGASASAKESEKDSKKEKQEELAKLKKELAAAQSDLDLLQRQLALQRDTYYSNPDYAHDTDGKAKLESMQGQITDKQQAIEELKTKVAALQELLGPDAQTEKPAAPTQ